MSDDLGVINSQEVDRIIGVELIDLTSIPARQIQPLALIDIDLMAKPVAPLHFLDIEMLVFGADNMNFDHDENLRINNTENYS